MRKSLYKTTEDMEIQRRLYPIVLSAFEKSKRNGEIKIFGFWAFLSLAFSPVTLFLLLALHKKLIESSTYEYVSLLLNDAEARSLYTKEILFAVYDTIPVIGAGITLVSLILVFVFYYKTMHLFSLISNKKIPAY